MTERLYRADAIIISPFMNKSTPTAFQPQDGGGDIVGAARCFGAGAGSFYQRFGQLFGRVGSGSGEFQLLEHPACAVHEEAIRHEHRIIPGGKVHHPALAVYPAQNADGEAGVPHGPRPPAVDEKARCAPALNSRAVPV